MTQATVEKPIRVGLFDDVADADRAVQHLLEAGWRKKQLAVLCSDAHKEKFFRDLPHPGGISGEYTPKAVVTGGVIGATIGGLVLAATSLATGGAVLLAAGSVLIGGGAIAGSFTGAMSTRGFKKEYVDYYDQAVQKGKILIAVEDHGENSEPRLAEAERILAEHGAEVGVPLMEG